MPEPRWEVGSEFAWDPAALRRGEPSDEPPDWLPGPHELFATGCGALVALLALLAPRGRLHLPSFFCMGVAELLAGHVAIGWYRHLPDGHGPRLDTLHAEAGDVVLAQNLFGRESRHPWEQWSAAHPDIPVVEDHTHDPFGPWASTSSAAYCLASLRKTLPLPDGALIWSPHGRNLPTPAGAENPGARQKLTAMLLKGAWLGGHAVGKPDFRALQVAGERALTGSIAPATTLTAAVLPLLDAWRLRSATAHNVRHLLAVLPRRADNWRVPGHGPPGASPFHVQLVCRSEAVRDALQAHLREHRIYAPVHWRQPRTWFWSGDDEAADLAARILTIPVDHRYRAPDIGRVGDVLRRFDVAGRAAGRGPGQGQPGPVPPQRYAGKYPDSGLGTSDGASAPSRSA